MYSMKTTVYIVMYSVYFPVYCEQHRTGVTTGSKEINFGEGAVEFELEGGGIELEVVGLTDHKGLNPLPLFEISQYCCLVSLQLPHRINHEHNGVKVDVIMIVSRSLHGFGCPLEANSCTN